MSAMRTFINSAFENQFSIYHTVNHNPFMLSQTQFSQAYVIKAILIRYTYVSLLRNARGSAPGPCPRRVAPPGCLCLPGVLKGCFRWISRPRFILPGVRGPGPGRREHKTRRFGGFSLDILFIRPVLRWAAGDDILWFSCGPGASGASVLVAWLLCSFSFSGSGVSVLLGVAWVRFLFRRGGGGTLPPRPASGSITYLRAVPCCRPVRLGW